MMTLRYGFDKDGGFVAIDDELQVASYAYPTSIHANNALRQNQEKIAEEMIYGESVWMHRLHPDFYRRMVEKLG